MKTKALVIGALLAAITLFAWQTVSHMVLPWHNATMTELSNNDAVVQAVRSGAPTNGVYYSKQGLLAIVDFTPDMADKSKLPMTRQFVVQIVINFTAALLLGLLLGRLSMRSPAAVATAFALAAFSAEILCMFSMWNWMGGSIGYAIVGILDMTISFALAGFVMGWANKKWGGVMA